MIDYFSFVTCVFILDTQPINTCQSETTEQQQSTTIKESEGDIVKKDAGRYSVNLNFGLEFGFRNHPMTSDSVECLASCSIIF